MRQRGVARAARAAREATADAARARERERRGEQSVVQGVRGERVRMGVV